MSVSNGQIANETIFNAAFVSRTAAQSVVGGKLFDDYVALKREDVATAATIAALDSSGSFVRMTGSTATTIQGITAGVNGQTLYIYNGSTATVTVAHQNGSASAANRLILPDSKNVIIPAGAGAEFIYDLDQARWVQKSGVNNPGGYHYVGGEIIYGVTLDSSTTGSAQTLPVPTTPIVAVLNASLTSLAGVTAGALGQLVYIVNQTGGTVTILNNSGSASAANRILSSTGSDVTLAQHGTIILMYDSYETHWHIVGGTGGSSAKNVETFTGTAVAPDTSKYDESFVYTGTSDQTFTGFGTISGLSEGYTCTLIGGAASYYLALSESDGTNGWLMNGPYDLSRGKAIKFEYNSTLARMVEISRQ